MAIVTGLKYKKSGGVPIGVAELEPTDQLAGGIISGLMNKNHLVNGNFEFFEEGSTRNFGPATAGEFYGPDQWIYAGSGITGTYSMVQMTPGDVLGSRWCMRANYTAAATAAWIGQKIESAYTLAGRKATVSFWARASVAGKKLGVRIVQNFGAGGSPSASTNVEGAVFTLGTTFQKFTYTFDVPSVAGKSFGASHYLYLVFDINGAGYSGALSGQIGQFDIAQAQLEAGEGATDFEYEDFALGLIRCQRYWEKSYDSGVTPGSGSVFGRCGEFIGVAARTTANAILQRFAVRKRNTPAVTVYASETGTVNAISQDNGTDVAINSVSAAGMTGFQVTWTNGSGRYGGSFHYTANARL